MSSITGLGTNSLSRISSIIKYDIINLNVGLGVEPLTNYKLRVINNSSHWQSALFSTNFLENANAIGIGNYYDSNNIDTNNSNNNATIYATTYNGYGFRDMYLNNLGTSSNNSYGNVIIRGKTTIGSYYNSSLYNYSLDINGSNNILNLRNNNNTLNFTINNSNDFNINTSSKKLYINNSLHTCNLNASNLNISYTYPIIDKDILVVGSGITRFENNSTINIGSNNNPSNNLNVHGYLYISSNVGIGIEPEKDSSTKINIAPGIIKFTNDATNNSTVNVGSTGINNILNVFGKTYSTSTIEIGTSTIIPEFALKTYGNILLNKTTLGIGSSSADIINNNLNIYAKSYFAGNIGFGTTPTDINTVKFKENANVLLDSNSTLVLRGNSKIQVLGLSHLNGNVIIGESNINVLDYGLYVNSNVCITNGLTVFTSNNSLVNIKGHITIDSNTNIKGRLTVEGGNIITGNGFGISNIKLSSIVKDDIDIADDQQEIRPLINARFINFDSNFFTSYNGKLTFSEAFSYNADISISAATIWSNTQYGIGYPNNIIIGNSTVPADSGLFQVGSGTSEYYIRTKSLNNPFTQISSDDKISSNTKIKMISSYNTDSIYYNGLGADFIPGSIIHSITGNCNAQHIFEYNNYNILEQNQNNIKKILMTISKTGIVAINSNIKDYIQEDNEKLIVNGTVNILNCNAIPTKLILGNSSSNNSILRAHGHVFVGSNIIIGNSIYFNSASHKELSRIAVASGTTQFADYTIFNIGIGTTSINNNSVNIYSKVGIGTNANKNTDFDNFIYGSTNFHGAIRFGNDPDDLITNVNFVNSRVGIGTVNDTVYDIVLNKSILIKDNSSITFGSAGLINNNSFNIYSKIGIGTSCPDNNLLKLGSGNIITDNNINFTYGTINSNNFNTLNLYSKVGIGTAASVDNILLTIGGNQSTINILDNSTINFGSYSKRYDNDSSYINIYGKINIEGSNTIIGQTIIGGNNFNSITTDNDEKLHIKKRTRFYDNVYFNYPIYFQDTVNFSQSVSFGSIDTVEFRKIKTSNLDATGGFISGFLSNSDSINASSTFGTINVDKLNYDEEYLVSNINKKLSFNSDKYSLWFNNNNNQFISYSNGVYITSNNSPSTYIANSANFQINVKTSTTNELHIGKNNNLEQSEITNTLLYSHKKSIFFDTITYSNIENSLPCIFTNSGNSNIIQIGNNISPTPNITGYQLNVNGSIGLTGNIFTNSDLRLKNNIRDIENPLEKILNCRGVMFNYLNDDNINIGVIAQEIEKILPEVVESKNNGFKTVNYLSIIGVLIEAIKELNKKIEK